MNDYDKKAIIGMVSLLFTLFFLFLSAPWLFFIVLRSGYLAQAIICGSVC